VAKTLQIIKKILKKIYGNLPSRLILNTFLKKFIYHKPIPRNISNFLISNTQIKLISASSPITRMVYWLGIEAYEKEELEMWTKLCKDSKSIVEMGGNIGYFTVFGAKSQLNKNYEVYEPLPYNFSILKKNLELNSLEHVAIKNVAVISDERKTVKFHVPKELSDYQAATGGFIEGAEIMDSVEVLKVISVECINCIEAIKGKDLIKMDVEGAEFEILNGAKEEIVKSKPIILLELLNKTYNLRSFIYELMETSNYFCFVKSKANKKLVELNSILINSINLPEEFGTRDLILCPQEKLAYMKNLLS